MTKPEDDAFRMTWSHANDENTQALGADVAARALAVSPLKDATREDTEALAVFCTNTDKVQRQLRARDRVAIKQACTDWLLYTLHTSSFLDPLKLKRRIPRHKK